MLYDWTLLVLNYYGGCVGGIRKKREARIVTRKRLKEYRALKLEIERLNVQIRGAASPKMINAGKVRGSSPNHPYLEKSFSVKTMDQTHGEREKQIREWEKLKVKNEKEVKEIEDFIENIRDVDARLVFRMHYIEGLSQEEVGNVIGYSRSWVAKKILDFFKE